MTNNNKVATCFFYLTSRNFPGKSSFFLPEEILTADQEAAAADCFF